MAACAFQQAMLGHAEHDATDIGPVGRTGAHAAGLHIGVERAAPEKLGRVIGGRHARQGRFRVIDGVDIALLHEHGLLIGAHQHGTEGVVAHLRGALGHRLGATQIALDLFGRGRQALRGEVLVCHGGGPCVDQAGVLWLQGKRRLCNCCTPP